MLRISVRGLDERIKSFEALPAKLRGAITSKMYALALRLEAYVKDNKLSGQVLKHRTGQLWQSIKNDVTVTGESVKARVYSAGNIKYAGIHEYGGTINHPGGTAYMMIGGQMRFISNAKAAAFEAIRRTRPHPIPMPMRSFLRSSLEEMRPIIVKELQQAATEALK